MTIQDQLDHARAVLAERGVDLSAAFPAVRALHLRELAAASDEILEELLLAHVAVILAVNPPYTLEHVARQCAESSGAFPWDGPVGNGLTLEHYQGRFREMAREHLFLADVLGLIPSESEGPLDD